MLYWPFPESFEQDFLHEFGALIYSELAPNISLWAWSQKTIVSKVK